MAEQHNTVTTLPSHKTAPDGAQGASRPKRKPRRTAKAVKPYRRPVCHCGHELVLFEEYVNEMCKAITEQGKIGSTLKRGFFKNEPRQTLRCLKCRNYYDVKFDEQRRVLRGRKHSPRQLHR